MDPFMAVRLQRGTEHLHRLGPRVIAEFLLELAERIGGLPAATALLVEYERLSPRLIRATGLQPQPLRSVPRDLGRGGAP
jgi:hypothetical protein